jgi:hypothetical protein
MININSFFEESNKNLTKEIYRLDFEKLKHSYDNYQSVINLPYYSDCNKNNKYEIACVIPFFGRKNIVKLNVELLNKQSIKPAIILTCSNIPDYNFAKTLENEYDNVFVNVTLNYPLGKKFYDSVKFAETLDNLKYLMVLGSDDLLSLNYIEKSIELLKTGYDLIGSRKWLVCSNDNKLHKFGYKDNVGILLGGGKIYTKKFLDEVNWKIFNEYRPIHLDEHGEYLFDKTNLKKVTLNNDEFILSIKGDWNCINTKEDLLNANNRLEIEDITPELPNIINKLEINENKDMFKQDKPKLCILTTLYLRHNLNEIVLDYYKKLKKGISDVCDIELIACGSDDNTNMQIATKNDFKYINHTNFPLTQKHNALFTEAKKYNPDFVILIGSDDLICENVIYQYIEKNKSGVDYMGILDFKCIDGSGYWYWGGYTNSRVGEPVGGGRYFSKRLLNELNWKPWGNAQANKSLDGISNENIKKLNKPIIKSIVSNIKDGVNLVTIRTSQNITDMGLMKGNFLSENPLNNLVIDKDGPINDISLPYKSNILIDLMPKTSYDKYTDKVNLNYSEIYKNLNNKIITNQVKLSDSIKKKRPDGTSNGNAIEVKKTEPPKTIVINNKKVILPNAEKLHKPNNPISKIGDDALLAKIRRRNTGFGGRR